MPRDALCGAVAAAQRRPRHPPDAIHPHYDRTLGDAFIRDGALFRQPVREDRSVLDLLTADYTFVNERIARTTAFRTSRATTSAA
jgi:hypothetical protein